MLLLTTTTNLALFCRKPVLQVLKRVRCPSLRIPRVSTFCGDLTSCRDKCESCDSCPVATYRRVLLAFALRNNEIRRVYRRHRACTRSTWCLLTSRPHSYLQGMNYLAAFLLLVAGEEESAFWLLAARKWVPHVNQPQQSSHAILRCVSCGGHFLRLLLPWLAGVPTRRSHPSTGWIDGLRSRIGHCCKVLAENNTNLIWRTLGSVYARNCRCFTKYSVVRVSASQWTWWRRNGHAGLLGVAFYTTCSGWLWCAARFLCCFFGSFSAKDLANYWDLLMLRPKQVASGWV